MERVHEWEVVSSNWIYPRSLKNKKYQNKEKLSLKVTVSTSSFNRKLGETFIPAYKQRYCWVVHLQLRLARFSVFIHLTRLNKKINFTQIRWASPAKFDFCRTWKNLKPKILTNHQTMPNNRFVKLLYPMNKARPLCFVLSSIENP